MLVVVAASCDHRYTMLLALGSTRMRGTGAASNRCDAAWQHTLCGNAYIAFEMRFRTHYVILFLVWFYCFIVLLW